MAYELMGLRSKHVINCLDCNIQTILPELLSDPDRAKAGRVMQAMMKMIKLDIAVVKAAADAK